MCAYSNCRNEFLVIINGYVEFNPTVRGLRAHFLAAICYHLQLKSPSDQLEGVGESLEWLQGKAESLVESILFPCPSEDPAFLWHSSFLHSAFPYTGMLSSGRMDLRSSLIGSGGSPCS